jgi:predicted  nucleic acid-binding Zn-ribbon protein
MECLSKSNHNYYKIRKISNTIKKNECYVQDKLNTDDTLALEHTVEILREQIETLNQELQYERQLVEEYAQELTYTHSEMGMLNHELQNVSRLEKLKVDKAKLLALSILSSDKSISESLAELLSGIYGILVTADDLEQIKQKLARRTPISC